MSGQLPAATAIVTLLLARAEAGDIRALLLLARHLHGTKKEEANV